VKKQIPLQFRVICNLYCELKGNIIKILFLIFFGAIPAFRYNLLFFKEKNKRISTTIGAKPNEWLGHFWTLILVMLIFN
jgi:hypothetical protein